MKLTDQTAEWSDIYTRYRPGILAFLGRRLWGRQELAEDLTQETFARAMGADVVMHDPSRIKSYLFRTANNLLISHLRRRGKVTAESDLGTAPILEAHPDQGGMDPLEASEAAQIRERVDRLVGGLPEDQQVAFREGVLRRVPYSQIAEANGWTVAKVKTCVFRARKVLMAELEDYRQAAPGAK